MKTEEFSLTTGSRVVTDITSHIDRWLNVEDQGLLSVFVPHATAGLALMETGAGSEKDLVDVLERLAPTEDIYRHRHGSTGHGRDHVFPAFVCPSLTIPVVRGRMLLGTWQSVCLIDTNVDNPQRSVRFTFISG